MRQDDTTGGENAAYESTPAPKKLESPVWHSSVSDLTPPIGNSIVKQTACHSALIKKPTVPARPTNLQKMALRMAKNAEGLAFGILYGDEFQNHLHATLEDIANEHGWAHDTKTIDRILDEKITQKFTKLCQLDDYDIHVYLLAEDAEDSFTSDKDEDDEIMERFDDTVVRTTTIGRVTYTFHRLSLKCEGQVYPASMLNDMWNLNEKKK